MGYVHPSLNTPFLIKRIKMTYKQDETGIVWNKAPFSTVEIAFVDREVWVRNSNDVHEYLIFTRSEWRAFVEGAKLGEFDV